MTLDLNRHTIFYGTAAVGFPAFGILGVACWDPDFGTGNPCGGSFNNLTVYGGTIVQRAQAAFSHAIRLGQGMGRGLVVHDVTFVLRADSSIAIFTTSLGTRNQVFDNVINNDVTTISNRHQQQGQSIKFADSKKVPGPAAIHGNHIFGGAQGGIFSEVVGSKIYDNIISHKATYTNDFGIYAWANGGEVFRNTVTPVLGRGIQIAGASIGEKVHDNTVIVIEGRVNQEYGGCQIGGAFGIQFDDAPQSATVFNNTVVAKADQCDAQALRVTDSRRGAGNSSHDNTFTAERKSNTAVVATGFGTGGATGFTSQRDTFAGDTSTVAFDWDGGQNLIFRECKFVKGAHSTADFVTFSFKNGRGHPVSGIRFVDSVFENGAERTSTDMRPIGSNGDWPGPSEYFVDWTLTLFVHDQQKRQLPGAQVSVNDAFGHAIYQGRTNHQGKLSVPLTEFRIYNTVTGVVHERQTPHKVNVTMRGCLEETNLLIDLDKAISREVPLKCKAN